MLYGDPANYELGMFGDFTVRVDESVKAVERMLTILGDAMIGGNLIVDKGFVVATVNHRDASSDPHDMFPAYLEDVKAAIRYLRANARQWHVDPDRLGIWGTSSGGNTSLLVGLTADDPRYEDGTNADESDAVKYVVSCFPPTDMLEAVDAFDDETNPFRLYYFGPFAAVVGATHETGINAEVRQRAADMSP